MRPTILTHSGSYFDYTNPEESEFTIDDIAEGLSKTCRFSGQCGEFYSVAQHSVIVSTLVPDEHALAALLHDASEAFMCDITSPLKQLLPDYRVIEQRVQSAIFKRFGVVDHPSVHVADMQILKVEQFDIMGNRDDWQLGVKVIPMKTILPLDDASAYLQFMARFEELTQ